MLCFLSLHIEFRAWLWSDSHHAAHRSTTQSDVSQDRQHAWTSSCPSLSQCFSPFVYSHRHACMPAHWLTHGLGGRVERAYCQKEIHSKYHRHHVGISHCSCVRKNIMIERGVFVTPQEKHNESDTLLCVIKVLWLTVRFIIRFRLLHL